MDMETQLILAAQAGDKQAYNEIVRIYGQRVYYTAYSFLHNMDDASDIVQEVFLRAYRNLSRFDPGRALFPWLHRITRNLCINTVQRGSNRERTLPPEELISARYGNPSEELLRNERQRELRTALLELPELHRQILMLKHFEDCSYAEIAEILDIPIGTVMSRLYNARQKLREKLLEVENSRGM